MHTLCWKPRKGMWILPENKAWLSAKRVEPEPLEVIVHFSVSVQDLGVIIVVVLGSALPVSHGIESPSSIAELEYHVVTLSYTHC